MILFFAPFPDPSKGDGWMSRICSVDNIFKDQERAYVYDRFAYQSARPDGYEPYHRRHDSLREEYVLTFNINRHVGFLAELIDKADFVYAHTAHSGRFLYDFYESGKIVTDLHGLAASEERMMGKLARGQFFEAFEERMIRKSAALITVTDAMRKHYLEKYPGCDTPFLLNPIRQNLPALEKSQLKRESKEIPTVIFAGGSQAWQQPEKMMSLVKELSGKYNFEIYSQRDMDYEKLRDKLKIPPEACHVGVSLQKNLPQKYRLADFGLVLREDCDVNRVACPTKLMEYMAYGVIPVVELYEIGDFAASGYHAISAEDFARGKIPSLDVLNKMRVENARICQELNDRCSTGIENVRNVEHIIKRPFVDMKRHYARFLSTSERMFYATEMGWCKYRLTNIEGNMEELGQKSFPLHDIPFNNFKVTFSLPPAQCSTTRVKDMEIFIFDKPYAVTPIKAWIKGINGKYRPVAIKDNHLVDKYGNYFFMNDPYIRLDLDDINIMIREVHLEFRLLLLGGETYFYYPKENINKKPEEAKH